MALDVWISKTPHGFGPAGIACDPRTSPAGYCITRVWRSETIDTFADWQIQRSYCREQGEALRGMTLPGERHPLADQPALAFLVECLAAAVCHSTNWDRLRAHMLRRAGDSGGFAPGRLACLTLDGFVSEFGAAFSPDVTDLARRHDLFTEVARAFDGPARLLDVDALIARPQPLAGPAGLYATLDKIPAFRADPQRKKARVFVQQLLRFEILLPLDPDELRPAIEHHLIRLYLRTGRVAREDGWPDASEETSGDLDSLTALRTAVEQAMHYTATAAGQAVGAVNEIEWQIARSYCDRDRPRCTGPARPDKPVADVIADAHAGTCPFAATCPGRHDSTLARLREPQLASHHAFY